MSKPRNDALHAEIDRITDLKLLIPTTKAIATKHRVAVGTVRQLISAALRRKRTNVMIHVEPTGAKIARLEGPAL